MICMEEATRYIALLRGDNISGKNKVPMAELKKIFEELGFGAVKTYLNSGNVIFSSDEENIVSLTDRIETTIKKWFGLDIPILVMYPGEFDGRHVKLFNRLTPNDYYRAFNVID